jgi:organic hydroperoxide reductase OsmC/OhrA
MWGMSQPAARIAPFPHRYQIALESRAAGTSTIEAAPREPITGGPPPQFGGLPTSWSPEELLLSAATLCLMTTFDALARGRGPAVRYRCQATGTLDKSAAGLAFTSIEIAVELMGRAEDAEAARALLAKAERYCIVKNSLKPAVTVHASFVADHA